MNKILIINPVHESLIEILEKAGFACEKQYRIDYSSAEKIIEQYTGIILRSGIKIDSQLLSKANNLKFIGRVGSGLESIDLESAKNLNIACFNSPEGSRDAVGEHTLGMLLNLFNRISIAQQEVKNGLWLREENRGIEIAGKTIGIIGYGNMGSSFAEKLSGFKCNVISYDKYKTNYSDKYTREVTLEEVFENADIISLHVPLTEETHYMVNTDFIQSCKKEIYIVNTSRGPVLKTTDLVTALNNGKVKGAALDVIEYEEYSFDKMNLQGLPEDFNTLLNNSNVLITPHLAGFTHESKIKLAEVLANKIIDFSRKNHLI